MGKRKNEDRGLSDSPSKTSEPMKKSKMEIPNDDDEYDVWLVCKTQSASLDILSKMKFPKSIRDKQTLIDINGDEKDTSSYRCDFRTLESQTFVLDSGSNNNGKPEDLNVKCQVGGVVNITCTSDISDGFPMPPEEDFNNLQNEVDSVSFPFVIKKINRRPQLKLDHLKQRLQAFGSIKKTGKKKKSSRR
uniref:Uncharacterized protein n=1 Tax=Strongyloides papillosus TaxID=174720 RepID=A0A0N5C753_STREA